MSHSNVAQAGSGRLARLGLCALMITGASAAALPGQVVDFRVASQRGAQVVVHLQWRVELVAGPMTGESVGGSVGLEVRHEVRDSPPDVTGRVTAVRDSDLVEISLGTDDDLRPGHTLTLFRGTRYVARARVQESRVDHAWARVIPGSQRMEPREDDRARTDSDDCNWTDVGPPPLNPRAEARSPVADTAFLTDFWESVSGVLVSSDGWVVTSGIPRGGRNVRATLADGRSGSARLLVQDWRTGLQLVKLDLEATPCIMLAEARIELGLPVVVVSALNSSTRTTRGAMAAAVEGDFGQRIEGMARLDAAVTATSVGAPVLDAQGELVGVVVAQPGELPPGMERDTPMFVATARQVRELLDARRADSNPTIIRGGALGADLVLDREGEIRVQRVGDRVGTEGLRAGDTLISLDGVAVRSIEHIERSIRSRLAGAELTIAVRREGREQTLRVTLGGTSEQEFARSILELLRREPAPTWMSEMRRRIEELDSELRWLRERIDEKSRLRLRNRDDSPPQPPAATHNPPPAIEPPALGGH